MTRIILSFLQVSNKTLEWTTSDGRTFQILGSYSGRSAYWERFFPPNDHPYRRQLTWSDALVAWKAAIEPLTLYSLRKDEEGVEQLTREQVLDRVEQMFPGSMERGRKMKYILASGEAVVDRFNSHVHENATRLLPAVFAKINTQGRKFLIEEVLFDRIVGETVCVLTTDADEIVWAKRPKRFGHSRFVKNRKPEPCDKVVVILKKDDFEDYYVLITAFIGHRPEPEPWDQNANSNSLAFWGSHALIWGSEEVMHDTLTTDCPW